MQLCSFIMLNLALAHFDHPIGTLNASPLVALLNKHGNGESPSLGDKKYQESGLFGHFHRQTAFLEPGFDNLKEFIPDFLDFSRKLFTLITFGLHIWIATKLRLSRCWRVAP